MAPVKETGRARRKGSTERVDSRRGRRSVAKEIGRGGEPAGVDVDPWGAFFEHFWGEAAESGGSGSGHGTPEDSQLATSSTRQVASSSAPAQQMPAPS